VCGGLHIHLVWFACFSVLGASKVLADEIQAKQAIADATEEKIDEARAAYQPVARHASLLYFAVADLGTIDPMYQVRAVAYDTALWQHAAVAAWNVS